MIQQWETRRDNLISTQARGNIYVDDASTDSWDLNWRAGSNQACFETFGSGARDALSIDYSGRTVDGVWTGVEIKFRAPHAIDAILFP